MSFNDWDCAYLAYKHVAKGLMVLEINRFASDLKLPISTPIQPEDITRMYLHDPGRRGFGGRVDCRGFTFTFSKAGKLRLIGNLAHPYYKYSWGSKAFNEYWASAANAKLCLDPNSAGSLARSWLRIMNVDLQELDGDNISTSTQMLFSHVPVSMFHVEWHFKSAIVNTFPENRRGGEIISISVLIDGQNGALVHLRQEDERYSRQTSVIKDLAKLLEIPDEEFSQYSPKQKSDLIHLFKNL